MPISAVREKFWSIIGITIWKLCLEAAYIFCIAPIWGPSLQFGYAPNWKACGISYIYCILLVLLLPEKKDRLSVRICHLFVITSVVPALSFYWINSKSHLNALGIFVMTAIICIIANLKPFHIYIEEPIGKKGVCGLLLELLFVLYLLGGLYLCIKGGGLKTAALSLVNASGARSGAGNLNTIEGYWLQWTAKAFTPFFMGYYVYYKKYICSFFCVIIQMILYFTFAHKAFLFSIVLFVMLFVVEALIKHAKIMYYLVFSFMAVCAVIYRFYNGFRLLWLIAWQGVMRMLVEPAKIKFQYFDYFYTHGKLFFSEGIVGKLLGLNYPYDKAIGFVITEYFYGAGAVSNSNTGVLGDMYSQMGYPGMVLGGIILGVLIWLLDGSSGQIPMAIRVAVIGYACITLNDNALQTTILSGGLVIMILLFWLFSSELHSDNKVSAERGGPL